MRSSVTLSTMHSVSFDHTDNFQVTPFEKTAKQNIWCLLIINLHITVYDVSLALQTHFLHMVLTSWTGISLIVVFFKNITPANSEGLLFWNQLPHISLQTWAGINTGCDTGGAENDQLKLTVQQRQQKCFRISASCTTEYQNTERCVPRSNVSNNFIRDPCHNKNHSSWEWILISLIKISLCHNIITGYSRDLRWSLNTDR